MQRKDIKIGEFYAEQPYKYSLPHKVKVIDFDGRVQQGGYGYRRDRSVAGITVEFVDTARGRKAGERMVVTGRELVSTWAEYEAVQEAEKKRRDARNDADRKTAAQRAELARQIEGHLETQGLETREISVYDDTQRAALKAVGFDTSTTYPATYYIRARFDVGDWMRHGDLNEDAVKVLLYKAEASER